MEDTKKALINKLNKLEKEIQEYRRTINLFIKSNTYRDHEIVETYIQIWKEIDTKPDRNRWLEALAEIYIRIRTITRGEKPEEILKYYRSFI